MFKLVIQDDEGKTTVVPLIRDEITVGRKEGNTIRLTERNVSRRHARILRANGAVAIEDLNSYNGVRVNGSRIQGRCHLNPSDRIQIGDYLIEIKSDDAETGVDPYGDQKTQPIERIDPMVAGGTPPPPPTPGASVPTAVVNLNAVGGQAAPASPAYESPAALADTDPSMASQAVSPGRLVVLSTNFAGREFELTKPAMVIGRTEDNDVCVNHRSISRHHAKIVRENGRYAIVDLQSSNGVRVNGEEYGKVELRRGDVVDLGHVRMRFVEPGEDFVFGRDAQAVDIGSSGGKGWFWALLAVLVVGGGVAAFALSRSDDGAAKIAAGDTTAEAPSITPAVNPSMDAAVEPAVDLSPEADQIRGHLEHARTAIHEERWADAQAEARKVLGIEAEHAEAQKIDEQARREMANELRHEDFKRAVARGDHARVARLFESIDHESVYRERALDDHNRMRDEYTAEMTGRAQRLVASARCRDLRRLAQQARAVWAEAGDAVLALEAECRKAVAAAEPAGQRQPAGQRPPREDPPPDTGPTPPVPSGPDAAELLNQSRAAAKAGQFGKALQLCEQALAKQRNDQENITVCAITACNLKNERKARQYINQIRAADRKGMVRQVCLKHGVQVD